MAWLNAAGKLAKSSDTRHLVFDDPSLISRLTDLVKNAMAEPTPPALGNSGTNGINGNIPQASQGSGDQWRPTQDCQGAADLDPIFHAPLQASPQAASALSRAFTILRDSCAGCLANNQALRETRLADAALNFAVDQAPFACGASPPTPDSTNSVAKGGKGASLTATPAEVPAVSDSISAAAATAAAAAVTAGTCGHSADVRLAVRAALQFTCNYSVGDEENQALLWDAWFPRGFMELVNGLKTDRRLLSLAVALIHNCCVARLGGEEIGAAQAGGGGGARIRRLAADKAFCCLLMKVVPYAPAAPQLQARPDHAAPDNIPSSSPTGSKAPLPPANPKPAAAAAAVTTTKSDDPAAEWLYLLFCRFVEAGLSSAVYGNVGIRGGGRPAGRQDLVGTEGVAVGAEAQTEVTVAPGAQQQRQSQQPNGNDMEEEDGVSVPDLTTVGGGGCCGGGCNVPSGEREPDAKGEDEEDFFFPVTPEQLIVLNLAEIAAGDEAVTGGERPTPQQVQVCNTLAAWLIDLLAAMPLDQSLRPRPDVVRAAPVAPTAAAAVAAAVARPPETEASAGQPSTYVVDRGDGQSGGHGDGDGETELARRCMREEARSAVLRALAALLAGCGDEVRCAAAAAGAFTRTSLPTAGAAAATAPAAAAADTPDVSASVGLRPLREVPEARLVPLCLRLLWGSGGAAEPKDGVSASRGPAAAGVAGAVPPEVENHGAPLGYGVGRKEVPAGRKVELLKVIGNACFRCQASQDLAREVGGLPLVLNHCAVDGANPLLREYALLAVRNLCEGNPANQAAIAALQPQGCTPGMDEALAQMGLEAHVDPQGTFRVGPRNPGM